MGSKEKLLDALFVPSDIITKQCTRKVGWFDSFTHITFTLSLTL